jgi:hypothetical protein
MSSRDIPGKIGATSQRSLRRLVRGYIFIYGSGMDEDPDIYHRVTTTIRTGRC